MGTSSGEYELYYECARRQISHRFRIFIQTLNPNFHSMKITLSMCQLYLGIYIVWHRWTFLASFSPGMWTWTFPVSKSMYRMPKFTQIADTITPGTISCIKRLTKNLNYHSLFLTFKLVCVLWLCIQLL